MKKGDFIHSIYYDREKSGNNNGYIQIAFRFEISSKTSSIFHITFALMRSVARFYQRIFVTIFSLHILSRTCTYTLYISIRIFTGRKRNEPHDSVLRARANAF